MRAERFLFGGNPHAAVYPQGSWSNANRFRLSHLLPKDRPHATFQLVADGPGMPVTQGDFARVAFVLIEDARVRFDPFFIEHI